MTAPADQPFAINFTNNDAGVPHNVEIHAGPSMTDEVVRRARSINGVDSRTYYACPPLQAGTYTFSARSTRT